MVNIRDIETYRENNQLEAKKAAGGLPGSLWETTHHLRTLTAA